mgnify:CR=1 FL=1|tara:strand:- start:2278 stop:2655 length:378 start_codon:yes stop_codon:yes gene_type:complete
MWGHIKRANHKFIYARSINNIADDDSHADSVCFPVSAMRGFSFIGTTQIILRFESPYQYAMGDNDDNDGVLLTLLTSNAHREFIDNFTREIAFGEKQFIVLCDNVTGERFDNVGTCGVTANVGAD